MKQLCSIVMVTTMMVCVCFTTNAQAVRNGDGLLSFGFGFGQAYVTSATGYTRSSSTALGPITVGYQKIISDVVGVGRFGAGGSVGMAFYSNSFRDGNNRVYKTSDTRTVIMARCSYHFDLPSKSWDLYAGLGLGLYLYSHKYETGFKSENVSSSSSGRLALGLGVFLGARYFFSDSFGVYAEVGHGLGNLNLGVTLKL